MERRRNWDGIQVGTGERKWCRNNIAIGKLWDWKLWGVERMRNMIIVSSLNSAMSYIVYFWFSYFGLTNWTEPKNRFSLILLTEQLTIEHKVKNQIGSIWFDFSVLVKN